MEPDALSTNELTTNPKIVITDNEKVTAEKNLFQGLRVLLNLEVCTSKNIVDFTIEIDIKYLGLTRFDLLFVTFSQNDPISIPELME